MPYSTRALMIQCYFQLKVIQFLYSSDSVLFSTAVFIIIDLRYHDSGSAVDPAY